MGGGVVLESGTHHELLQDINGPYARLVAAQRLRDAREKRGSDDDGDDTAGSGEGDDMEKDADDEVALGRTTSRKSGRSLASEALEQKLKAREGGEKDYSLPYLFYRMGKINRIGRNKYVLGGIAACRTSLFFCLYASVGC